MSQLTVNFTEPASVPSEGYLVKYRVVGAPSYTTVSPNPTSSPVVITISDPTLNYEGTIQSICDSVPGLSQSFTATACSCPGGYTVKVDGSGCYKYNTAAPSITFSDYCLAASQNSAYSSYGTRIYSSSFVSTDISNSGPVHVSTTISPIGYWRASNSANGPMNRSGVWVDSNCDGSPNSLSSGAQTTIAYAFVNTTGAPQAVYIGLGGDNQFTLQINGTIVATTTSTSLPENFRWWHVVPYTMQPGNNLINLVGTGDGSVNDSIAMIIYRNTEAQLIAANTDADLDIAFSTASLRGTHIDIATCATGYDLDTSGGTGNYICKQLVTTSLNCS